jgi:hypothetical protein
MPYMNNDLAITVNSVDISSFVTSGTWSEQFAELETTAMGDSRVTMIAGLGSGSISLELHQSFAASETYATLDSLLGTVTTVEFTPVGSDSVAATNPKKSVSVLVTELPFVDGAVGDLSTISVTWPMTGAVTTATS